MFARRSLAVFVAALGISLTLPDNVSAGFISVSGAGNILDPSVTPTGATPNFFNDTGDNRLVHGWNEKQNVTLDRDVFVDVTQPGIYNHNNDLGFFNQYVIARDTVVSSHLLFYDPNYQHQVQNVTFVFDRPIIGVIVASDRFFNQAHGFTDYFMDSDFLGNPLTIYPATHFENRGLELNQADAFTFSVAGDRLILNWGANSPGDQIRVITAGVARDDDDPGPNSNPVPAPPAVILTLGGIATLGLARALRRRVWPPTP